jgi:hypothetical protein
MYLDNKNILKNNHNHTPKHEHVLILINKKKPTNTVILSTFKYFFNRNLPS